MPEQNGGAPCEATNGQTRDVFDAACAPQVAVATPVNCIGSWSPNACYMPLNGMAIQNYTVSMPEQNGGAPCEATNGQTREMSDPNCVAVATPVSCIGSWGPNVCQQPLNSMATQTYTVSMPEQNGGAPCEATNGQTRDVFDAACAPAPPPACISSGFGACNALPGNPAG
jgi:hypothetical protein